MEYSPEAIFQDLPSARIMKPYAAESFKTVSTKKNTTLLKTSALQIRFTNSGSAFNTGNLSIKWTAGNASGTWNPGAINDKNLGGTYKALDYVDRYSIARNVVKEKSLSPQNDATRPTPGITAIHGRMSNTSPNAPIWLNTRYYKGFDGKKYDEQKYRDWPKPLYPPGILSRNGWMLLDESSSARYNPESDELAAARNKGYIDWYFFAYGADYAQGLRDYITLFGPIPLIPRWAFGSWYSVYKVLSADDQMNIIDAFRRHNVPLDVLVLDMDWHTKPHWDGWLWDKSLYPNPAEFIRSVHEKNIKLTLNIHPLSVTSYEPGLMNQVAKELDKRPESSSDKTHQAVRFDLANGKDIKVHTGRLLTPLLKQGVDFFWLDGSARAKTDVDDQLWSNHVYYNHSQKITGKRPLILSRNGGAGSHRYPANFSGDTWAHWEVLAHQIDVTARAGNIGIAYWSHDLGGFNGPVAFRTQPGDHTYRGLATIDPELYARWVQFGAFSPILKSAYMMPQKALLTCA
jgi:alpha-glucosidase (family GH31 glycosyl hydrolase)